MRLLLKVILFTLLLPGTVAIYVPLWIASSRATSFGTDGFIEQAAAVLLVLLGVVIYLWCLWDFASFGRGTPAPIDAPKRLVVRGLYRYVRNPMYVGVLTVISGWALLFSDIRVLGYALGIWTCFHTFVLVFEEPKLRSQFGESYAKYCDHVPRWIPRLRVPRAV